MVDDGPVMVFDLRAVFDVSDAAFCADGVIVVHVCADGVWGEVRGGGGRSVI